LSDWKEMTSSMRLRNSGLKVFFDLALTSIFDLVADHVFAVALETEALLLH